METTTKRKQEPQKSSESPKKASVGPRELQARHEREEMIKKEDAKK